MSRNTIEILSKISKKNERRIIGCLSGTSMDGLDIGVCRISGYGFNTRIALDHFSTIAFPVELKDTITEQAFNVMQDMHIVSRLNTALGRWIGESILYQLSEWKCDLGDIDAIASHGQTMFHAPNHTEPDRSGTFQIGDADQIAQITGKIVVSDFRQKHISHGGEGAPLAPYLDWVMASSEFMHRVLINIGGIANLTFIPPQPKFNELVFGDTGPGNTLIDRFCALYFNQPYDASGLIARSGKLHHVLFEKLKSHDYFVKPLPKTTGQEIFSMSWLDACLIEVDVQKSIEPQDVLATLTHLTAWSIAGAVKPLIQHQNAELYVSGGGAKNDFMLELLEYYLGKAVSTTAELGMPPDAKESMLFALLANETLCGDGFPSPNGKGTITFGKISLPD